MSQDLPQLGDSEEKIRCFSPSEICFHRHGPGEPLLCSLLQEKNAEFFPVIVISAFPRSAPETMLQIFQCKEDGTKGKFLGMLGRLSDLPDFEQRQWVFEVLREYRLIPQIHRITALEESRLYVLWSCETDRGFREVLMRQPHRNIIPLSEDRLLFIDAEENQFEILSINALDRKSRDLLERIY